jgi:hypothetical protein
MAESESIRFEQIGLKKHNPFISAKFGCDFEE